MNTTEKTRNWLLVAWAVGSALWFPAMWASFDVNRIMYEYQRYDAAKSKVARGRHADPLRYDYYVRTYKRVENGMHKTNRKLGIFVIMCLGGPIVSFAIGSRMLNRAENKRTKKA